MLFEVSEAPVSSSSRTAPASAPSHADGSAAPWFEGRDLPWLALACALVAVVYASSWSAGFTLDDRHSLLTNPVVQGEVPWWEAFVREYRGKLFSEGWASSYRPVTVVSFTFVHRIADGPRLQHLCNLFVYALVIVQVARFSRRFFEASAWRWLAALAFAVMPAHVENVASIVGRSDLLSVCFGLVALELALPAKGEPPAGRVRTGLSCLAFALALLSKESIAPLPAAALWLAWREAELPAKKLFEPRTTWAALRPALPLALTGVAYILIRQQWMPVGLPEGFVHADNQLVPADFVGRFVGRFTVLGHYVELFAWPAALCADHTYADVWIAPGAEGLWRSPAAPYTWLGIAATAGCGYALLRALRRPGSDGRAASAWVLFAIAMILLAHGLTLLSVIVAERLMLWPSVFLAIALAASLPKATPRARQLALAGTVLVIVGWGLRSRARAPDWNDPVSLHESSARACPRAVHGRLNAALAHRNAGHPAEAVWHYALAAAGRSAYPGPWESLAFEAERLYPLEARLARLPEVLGIPPERLWPGMHAYLVSEGAMAEANLVAALASGGRGAGETSTRDSAPAPGVGSP